MAAQSHFCRSTLLVELLWNKGEVFLGSNESLRNGIGSILDFVDDSSLEPNVDYIAIYSQWLDALGEPLKTCLLDTLLTWHASECSVVQL